MDEDKQRRARRIKRKKKDKRKDRDIRGERIPRGPRKNTRVINVNPEDLEELEDYMYEE